MRNKILYFLSIVFFIYGKCLFANGENIKIEDYSYKDGLTTSGVNSVYKDSKGFLWLCSNNGLFRFDGYSFRNINSLVKDNLNLETYCITEDSDNNFLIGTVNGIFYYNTHIERLFKLQLSPEANCKISCILLLQGKIWAASDIGLLIITPQNKLNSNSLFRSRVLLPDSLHRRTPQDNIVNTLFYVPGSPSLWVGTNGALYQMDIKSLIFQYVNSNYQNSIRGISKYNDNIIVSSWDGGVFLVNSSRHKFESNPFIESVNQVIGDKRVMSASIDNQNRLWVATFGNGLYTFEKTKTGELAYANYRNNQQLQENLKSDFINQMYIDNTGIVWLSMTQPALSKVYFQDSNLKYISFPKQKNDHDSKEISAINPSTDGNKLWVATNGSGIYLFDIRNHSFVQYSNKNKIGLKLQNNEVTLCYQDKKGNLWIVYRRNGLYVVPAKITAGLIDGSLKNIFEPVNANSLIATNYIVNPYITTFFEDSSGRLWIGTWGSLYIVELESGLSNNLLLDSKSTCVYAGGVKENTGYPISPLLSIVEIKKNNFLLGTHGAGIIQLVETSNNTFTGKQLNINKKLPSNSVQFICKGKTNGVWIGTNAGIGYWNVKSDSLKIITSRDGLSSENINNIVEDNNSNIWVSTSYGISQINAKGLSVRNYFHFKNENYNQYIPNAGILTHTGIVCFSTNESLVMINPDSVEINLYETPLYFTDIKIDNKTVVPLEKSNGTQIIDAGINECNLINVPYNHTLSIEFAALDYLAPERISYKYKIGDKSDWILLNPGQRSLTLPNLSSGEYNLSIKVANISRKSNIRNIRINYLPPFYLTKTAYVIYSILILVLLLTYRRLLIQRVLQKSIIENERFERKKIEELDKMKSEFFSNISHEFRTPLSLIINPLEKLFKEDEISIKNKEKIRLILKSSNRLLKLTNELMDFSKIEKKLLTPDFQLYEITTFVNEICQLFNNLADTMNLDFKINCSFERLEIPMDKGMIEKVIFNLLSNAFKYTSANGMIMVNVTKSHISENEFVKLSVINTGEGIARENLSRIFDRYYQVNNVHNRDVEGTGLGLAIVKSFVELHNGKVEVKSEPNVETCFDIYLPVIQDKFNGNIELNASFTGRTLKDFALNHESKIHVNKTALNYRLLVVEDEDDIRNYIIEELSSEFKILSAKNGEEGFNLANKVIPDLIITDVMMPGLSGFELCKKLKNQVITSHIPILILSAKTAVDEQIEGLEMGADVYMIKPFNIDHLKAQIVRLINFKQTIYSSYIKENSLVPQGALSTKLDEEFMQKVMAFIEENLTNSDLSVDQLANCVSLSKVQTYRKVKAISGLSIVEFIRTIRLKKAAQMIMEGRMNFSEIAFETGFSTPSYFSKCFHDHFGKTPSEFASSRENNAIS